MPMQLIFLYRGNDAIYWLNMIQSKHHTISNSLSFLLKQEGVFIIICYIFKKLYILYNVLYKTDIKYITKYYNNYLKYTV